MNTHKGWIGIINGHDQLSEISSSLTTARATLASRGDVRTCHLVELEIKRGRRLILPSPTAKKEK